MRPAPSDVSPPASRLSAASVASATRVLVTLVVLVLLGGCSQGRRVFAAADRPLIERRGVEYPVGLELEVAARGFTAATAVAADDDNGHIYVGDRSVRGSEVRITRLDPATGELRELYPARDAIVSWFDNRPRLFAPVGGLLVHEGELYVAARGDNGLGVIVAFDLRGWTEEQRRPNSRTVVGDLPARGDFAVTGFALHPYSGRLFFGVGATTNSGVVGLDSHNAGWLRRHRDARDVPFVPLRLFGYRFDTDDPFGGLLRPDKVNTAPFHPFGRSGQRVAASAKPTAAVYSVDPRGGDLRVEAHGLRHPAGIAFTDFAALYVTNQGMEMRGTRPVRDDPDVVVRVFAADGADAAPWYGWPDYSADLRPVTHAQFQPPRQLLERTGYGELSFLIDHAASGRADDGTPAGLRPPDQNTLLTARFPPLSGAGGSVFVPEGVPGFGDFRGTLVVALRGDRAPFATSGVPLRRPLGRAVMAVDVTSGQVSPLVYNTTPDATAAERLVRPVDVCFGLDGLWILDQGDADYRDGRERLAPGTGRLLLLRNAAAAPPDPVTPTAGL